MTTDDETYVVPPGTCPTCGHVHDAATLVQAPIRATPGAPGPGDFSICAECLAVNVFEAGGRLRAATREEMGGLSPGQFVMAAIHFMRSWSIH